MKSKIKTNSGKIFSARKTSIFFAILFMLVLAISYSCKKGGGGDPTPGPTYFRVSKTDNNTNLIRSVVNKDVGSNLHDIQIYFDNSHAFKVTVTSLSTNNGSGGEESILSNVINTETTFNSVKGTWSLSLSNDAFTNSDIVGTTPIPLKIGLLVQPTGSGFTGTTDHAYTIDTSIQYANLITNTGDLGQDKPYTLPIAITNDLTSVNTTSVLELKYSDSSLYKFTEDGLFLTNGQQQNFTITNSIFKPKFEELVKGNVNFGKYFSDITLTPSSNSAQLVSYTAIFTPHFTNEMSNATTYQIHISPSANGNKVASFDPN